MRDVLADRRARAIVGATLLARLPSGMLGIGLVLLTSRLTGSYALAGCASGLYVAGVAVASPLLEDAADRRGRAAVLWATGFSSVLVIGATAELRLGAAGLLAGSCCCGFVLPPASAVGRSALAEALASEEVRRAAFGLDATLGELVFIAGPGLVALLAALAGARAALVAAGCAAGVGAAVLASVVRRSGARAPGARMHAAGVVTPPLRRLLATAFLFLGGCAVVEIAAVAFASGGRASPGGSTLLLCWGGGSFAGGVALTAHVRRRPLAALTAATALGMAVLAAAGSVPVLAALLVGAGCTLAPMLGRLYGEVARFATDGRSAEVFGWLAGALSSGGAVGAALGGVVVARAGARLAFLAAGALVALGALAARGATAPVTAGAAETV